jgi:hypothetical protein
MLGNSEETFFGVFCEYGLPVEEERTRYSGSSPYSSS